MLVYESCTHDQYMCMVGMTSLNAISHLFLQTYSCSYQCCFSSKLAPKHLYFDQILTNLIDVAMQLIMKTKAKLKQVLC